MRLTNAMREMIRDNAMKDKFGIEQEKLEKSGKRLAALVYEENSTPEERAAFELLCKRGWVSTSSMIYVSANGYCLHLHGEGSFPSSCYQMQTKKYAERVVDYANEKKKLAETISEARLKLDKMLSSISTFKQLNETWPEGAEYFNPVVKSYVPTANLPAVRIEEVNAIFGLPKKGEKK